jgi:hypothetical protein
MSDRDLKDAWKAAGYSMEEMWFFRYNQELIERLKEKKSAFGRPQLRLIQGGAEGANAPVREESSVPVKKAA